jgi:hypothetical protein
VAVPRKNDGCGSFYSQQICEFLILWKSFPGSDNRTAVHDHAHDHVNVDVDVHVLVDVVVS